MLYLAQVKKNPISGDLELQFLAHQETEHSWQMSNSLSINFNHSEFCCEGLLLLVELNENQELMEIKLANDLLIGLLKKYLFNNEITPEFVEKEKEKVEKWRQEITTKSLDLTRRSLEIETRRDRLQELETTLKQETEKLESRWQQLHQLQEQLQQEKATLKDNKQKLQD